MTKQEFIETIAGYVQKYAPMFNIGACSAIIAQACLESSYGTSYKAQFNNFFGLKYRKDRVMCNSGYFSDGGSEQDESGVYTLLPDSTKWYAFENIEMGVLGYFQFINTPNYSNLKGVNDPYEYLQNIKKDKYATSKYYVDNVYTVVKKWNLTKYDTKEVSSMSNSPLADCTKKSPNHSGARTHKIDTITPHCVVGQLSAESIGGCFTSAQRKASCNYGIGKDGRVVLCVDEANRSWCSSSESNDQRAVTIECASDKVSPYTMNNAVYSKLIELCVDICKRNGIKKLLFLGDKATTLAYKPKSDEAVLTAHRWFKNKACPGDWLYSRYPELAKTVTERLNGSSDKVTTKEDNKPTNTTTAPTNTTFKVRVLIDDLNIREQPNSKSKSKGFTGKGVFTITEVVGKWGKLKSGKGYIYIANEKWVTKI